MRERLVAHGVAAAVTAVVLAPLALPGYVLRYDMVFVPRQALSWDVIAPASALPRAVPQDAVVALLTQLVPGWLLQRLVLVAILWLAALGAARLVPTDRLAVRVVAAFGYAWTPYLAERLLIGQWGLLLAYAMLPWLVAAALDVRAGRPGALRTGRRRDEAASGEGAVAAAAESDPAEDLRGSVAYKRDLVRVLTARAIRGALERAAH